MTAKIDGPGAATKPIGLSFVGQFVLRRLSSASRGSLRVVGPRGETLGTGNAGEDRTSTAAVLQVVDPRFFRHVALRGSLGLAEAYLQGWWQTPNLTVVLDALAAGFSTPPRGGRVGHAWNAARSLAWRISRRNSRRGSRANILAHYDLGNEFFEQFLDASMTYSAGLFASERSSLENAQSAKYERICRLLAVEPGDHVLEIGCGWGGLAEHLASRYDCRVTAITISRAQLAYAVDRIRRAGLADRVEVRLCDYRDVRGSFDKIASIEMIEAVGHEYLGSFFQRCSDLLAVNGRLAIQAITIPDQRYVAYRRNVDFIQRHIFPGGCLPSLGAIHAAVGKRTDLRLVEQRDFAEDYERTLYAWRERFHESWPAIATLGFDERFRRLWDYYLCYCAVGFKRRLIGLSQLAFAKPHAA